MIYLNQNETHYDNDFRTMIQAFFPGEKIVITPEDTWLTFQAEFQGQEVALTLYQGEELKGSQKVHCLYQDKKASRNPIKAASYQLLSQFCGRTLPWGGMTGVRPTKFATARLEAGWSREEIVKEYTNIYLATEQKGDICYRVAKREQELLIPFSFKEEYCLYVGIPFCPTRCLYCSFASYPLGEFGKAVESYLAALKKELEYVAKAYAHKRLVAIYMGGGTPTSLSAAQMKDLIGWIYALFDTSHVLEFTVEAGRPDSVDEDKFAVLKEMGVTRISINPQTMHDETLAFIGRAHTAQMTVDAFHMARRCGMDNINMDIIVGLPKENISHVRETLAKIRELNPESLTVHSLAIKRAARLNIEMEQYRDSITGSTNEMLMLADEVAKELQMNPYYLYRQKNIPGNLENVGYAKPGSECLYNILIMEEKMDIMAVGAGTSTKLVFPDENRIERVENVKNLQEYILRIDEMIKRKEVWLK